MKKELWAKVKIILICILIIFVLSYVIVTIYMFSIGSKYVFRKETNDGIINSFEYLFKDEMKDKEVTFYTSRGSGYAAFYNNESMELLIMELTQYQNLEVNKMEIKNKYIPTKKVQFIGHNNMFSSRYPYFLSVMWVKKVGTSHLYIDEPPETVRRGNDYIYARFINNIFAISSIEKYPELNFSIPGDAKYFQFELLILKRDGKVYFIIGHPMESGKKIPEEESLLRLISLPGALPR